MMALASAAEACARDPLVATLFIFAAAGALSHLLFRRKPLARALARVVFMLALTIVLLLVAFVTLLVSGIGIMNIMLATVTSRIREIGIRKAVGATNREIRFQFLAEAILISSVGGIVGILAGLAVPYSVRFLTDYRIPISGVSAIVAILVSALVGIIFGTVPAARASLLDPVESLRHE